MVIFYAGQVLVLNDFPVEKANEIMMVATGQKHPTNAVPPPYMVPSPAESTTNSPGFDRLHFHHQPPLGSGKLYSNLPYIYNIIFSGIFILYFSMDV